MKQLLLFLLAAICTLQMHAQNQRSPFRKSYIRMGFSFLGKDLEQSLSPKENVFDGRHGADRGLAFNIGRVFYIGNIGNRFKYGLDWTIASFSYNKLNGWIRYGQRSGADDFYTEGLKEKNKGIATVSASSKLGPVFSFNPVEKLVIDARIQAAPVARAFVMLYTENEGKNNERSFFYYNGQIDSITSYSDFLALGVNADAGITVRRGPIGISLDYLFGKMKTSYQASDGLDNVSFGKAKVPVQDLQVKLSLHF